jgi:hypothetical protein
LLPRLILTHFGVVATTWLLAFTPTESRQYDVVIDETFAEADKQVILGSIEAWHRAVPELALHATFGPGCDPASDDAPKHARRLICVRLVDESDIPENVLGLTLVRKQGYEVIFPAGTTQDTVAHELGHAMGLKHSKQCGTLMYPSRYHNGMRCDAPRPTSLDIAAWHAIRR